MSKRAGTVVSSCTAPSLLREADLYRKNPTVYSKVSYHVLVYDGRFTVAVYPSGDDDVITSPYNR